MKYYKLQYQDGTSEVVSANSDIELIRKYDLATRKHVNTRIIQYEHDQLSAVTEALELSTK